MQVLLQILLRALLRVLLQVLLRALLRHPLQAATAVAWAAQGPVAEAPHCLKTNLQTQAAHGEAINQYCCTFQTLALITAVEIV